MPVIKRVIAREILDSRGNPTLEVEIMTEDGLSGSAMVPSGASTGKYEAVELRDKDAGRYLGKGVLKAVAGVNRILGPAVQGMDVTDQAGIDQKLIETDGSPDKSKMGANAILGVSMAAAYAGAKCMGIPLYRYLGRDIPLVLPVPMFNILNGGKHATGSTDFQEFMVMPAGAQSYSTALQMGVEIYHSLKQLLGSRGLNTATGDEGGFAPAMPSNTAAVEVVLEAVAKAGYKAGKDCFLALDVAGSELYANSRYVLAREGRILDAAQMAEYYVMLTSQYPVISIEDGMDEDDWEGWRLCNRLLGSSVQLVGDDLYVTNITRLSRGIREQASNSILIKLNQIGTVTETIAAVEMARKAGFTAVISHRSGETEDTTIADLAVALGTGQIKAGAPCRSERTAKYNRLLKIESELGSEAKYCGMAAFYNLRGKADENTSNPPTGLQDNLLQA